MTSMKERREQAHERIAEMLKHAPDGVDKHAWLREQLGVVDFDEPEDLNNPRYDSAEMTQL